MAYNSRPGPYSDPCRPTCLFHSRQTLVVLLLFRRIKRNYFRRRYRSDPRWPVLELIEPHMVCVELGVWKGGFSKRIARMYPRELHLVDPWRYQPEYEDRVYGKRAGNDQAQMDAVYKRVAERFGRWPGVFVHRMTCDQAAVLFGSEYFDWIYLDANHGYDFVKSDLGTYLPKVKAGGYITGDDYVYARCPKGGPKRAVEEAVDEHGLERVAVVNNQFILRKRG